VFEIVPSLADVVREAGRVAVVRRQSPGTLKGPAASNQS